MVFYQPGGGGLREVEKIQTSILESKKGQKWPKMA